ncbi:aromatic ring-hydroxylating oxygenase subunit alpha [Actinomadura terrae]|uniref:aromatic ring-hydroxylating oxygenase subunit alpha n=1 Tax=Actinomadura terrae TaxID=604353 RepID=UPI001FA70838|nr:Rieske 2Fe-2S domain-containing protein [Actinomadura terrae]
MPDQEKLDKPPHAEPTAPPRRTHAARPTRPRKELGYPKGWFAVAMTRELARQKVLRRRLADQDIVLYRTRTGRAYAVDPHCPHLGAHLGVGGTVEGENLVCPFHRFAFAPDGTCAGSPDGAMTRGRLRHHHLAERNGIVYLWHGHDGAAPDFEPPHAVSATVTATASWTTSIDAHLQDVVENVVDNRHLAPLHGLRSVQASPIETNGPELHLRMSRSAPGHGLPGLRTVQGEASIVMEGLGCTVIRVRLTGLRLTLYLWSLDTPIGPRRTQHRQVAACLPDRPHRPLTDQALSRAIAWTAVRSTVRVIRQDIAIWTHQRHQRHPHLARGDEAISAYRRWARQFYPAPDPTPPRTTKLTGR